MNEKSSEDILLELVIEYFIKKWSPVWSKFLFNLENIDIAPSTIRKYLNTLEKKWFLYQPYNSSWRLPTIEWIDKYILWLLDNNDNNKKEKYNYYLQSKNEKFNLRWFIEMLWQYLDGVVFWHYENDPYIHYLWVSKILKKANNDIEQIIPLMDFIEKNHIIWYISKKETEEDKVNYSFLNYHDWNIALMYIKIIFEWKPAVIWVLNSLRADYKTNIKILKKVLSKWNI